MSLQYEQAVLGILLAQEKLTKPRVVEAMLKLNKSHFKLEEHQKAFEYLQQAYYNDKPIYLTDFGTSVEYFYGLVKDRYVTTNLMAYVDDLINQRDLEEIKAKVTDLNTQISESESIEEAFELCTSIPYMVLKKTSQGLSIDSVPEAIKILDEAFNNPKALMRYPTGDLPFDEIFRGGVLKPSLNVIAGQSGTGKTTYAAKLLSQLSINNNYKCAFFSLEMDTY